MKLGFNARNWHNWISIILVLPILIVAITAIFIAHHKALGMEDIDVTSYFSWLPGYSTDAKSEKFEIRTILQDAQGQQWVGTQNGLLLSAASGLTAVKEFAGNPVRDLVIFQDKLIAATKNGVWLYEQGTWRVVYKGDSWSANLVNDRIAVSIKDKGIVYSTNGLDWQQDARLIAAMSELPKEIKQARISLEKLNMDFHTGKAFFGKNGEWIWIDIIGFVLTFLCGTGIYLWWRGEQRKKELAVHATK